MKRPKQLAIPGTGMRARAVKSTQTTNGLQASIVTYLNSSGFKAWSVYNGGVWDPIRKVYRKNKTKLLGVSDVNGYRKSDGKAIYVEVKNEATGDTPSDEQIEFIAQAQRAGCIAFFARSYDDFLEQFTPYDPNPRRRIPVTTIP